MSGPNYDWGKMAIDPEGNKLLRKTFKSFIPEMFPELNEEEIKEKIDGIMGEEGNDK